MGAYEASTVTWDHLRLVGEGNARRPEAEETRDEGAVQPRRSQAVQHEGEAASGNGSHATTASAADAAAARRVAEVKRRGTQLIALDANAQLQREQRLRNGAGWDKATRYAAMVTRIRVEGGIADHIIPVPAASVGGIVMVPVDEKEGSPSAEAAGERRGHELPVALGVGGFGVPWRAGSIRSEQPPRRQHLLLGVF